MDRRKPMSLKKKYPRFDENRRQKLITIFSPGLFVMPDLAHKIMFEKAKMTMYNNKLIEQYYMKSISRALVLVLVQLL